MPKNKQTPGTELTRLLEKHGLNYNRLAKAIGLSSAMVRLIARDENPVSASVAFRLARFFKTKPEYWMELQLEYDIAKALQNKKLAKDIKDITTVDKAVFVRKPKTPKSPAAAKGKKTAAKKPAAKKAAPAKASVKKTAEKKPAAKKAPVESGAAGKAVAKPAAKPEARQEPKPIVKEAPAANQSEGDINEPQI